MKVKDIDKLMEQLHNDKREAFSKHEVWLMLSEHNTKVPTVDVVPKGHWIPVSERLPETHDEVLVTAHGEVSIAWLYLDGEWRSNDMPQQMFKDIIAWMPLPDVYREDGE